MRRVLFFFLALVSMVQLDAQVIFYVESPAPLVGNQEMTWADPAGGWGTPDMNIPANAILDTLAFAYDGTAADSLCCSAVINPAQVAGKIAVLYRGTCEFGVKALNAQNAGAVGVVIINNIPGAPVAMGAGAQGINVTIPVAMLTQAEGAALAAEIQAGNVTAFFGSKFGFYKNDLGMWPKDYILPPSSSNPKRSSNDSTEFIAEMGSWIFNFGQNDQTNVRLHGQVSFGGSTLYTQSSSAINLPSGDSIWVALPRFAEASYASGLYKLKYSITSDSTDEFLADNERRADFTVSDTLLTYATLDTNTLMPINGASYRPSGNTTEFEVCVHYKDSLASRLATTGMYFSASTGSADSLNGLFVETILYEWNDAFTDVTGTVTFDALNPILYGGYTYPTNQQNEMVWSPFSNPYTLVNNQRYLFCVHALDPQVFIGFGTGADYDENINTYLQPISPISDAGNWFWAGFGSDVVPSVAVKLFDATTLGNEPVVLNHQPAYPNPASNIVNIPLTHITGEVTVSVIDMQGKLIKTEVRNLPNSSTLSLNIEGIADGQYVIRLSTANAEQSFKILINH